MSVQPIIFETILGLVIALVALEVFAMAIIQFVKDKAKLEDGKAEVLSLVVGFLFGLFIVLSLLEQVSFVLGLSQWLGVIIFLAVAAIAPAGGYKLLKGVAGKGG
jgi:hypothetical protein